MDDPQIHAVLSSAAEQYPTPAYVYFLDQVFEQITNLRQAFVGFELSFAVKCNPNARLLARLLGRVDSLDISSAGELRRALNCGWSADRLSFTGPGKRPEELATAVEAGTGCIVVESVIEAKQLAAIVDRTGSSVRQPILVRIGPARLPRGYGVRMSGRPSQFGIDEEELDAALPQILAHPQLELRGFHAYVGTQCLDEDALVESFALCAERFRMLADRYCAAPPTLVFGPGIGIPYHSGDQPVNIARLGVRARQLVAEQLGQDLAGSAQLVLELGRYLVGDAGYFLTRVIALKSSRGVQFAICDGGMNHHAAACGHLGSVIHRNYRMFVVGRTLEANPRTYELVGPLCTSIDTLARAIELPTIEVGDLIAVCSSGAYGLTASPLRFIGHPAPRELIVESAADEISITDAT